MIDKLNLAAMFLCHRNPKGKTSLDEFAITHPLHDPDWRGGAISQWYSTTGLLYKLFQASQVVLLDDYVDDDEEAAAAPICCHVRYDSEPIVNMAAQLYHRTAYPVQIWLPGNEGEERNGVEPHVIWEGAQAWTKMLSDEGVKEEDIHTAGPVYNTPDEHLEFIRLAQENRWPALHLVGAPYHMLRIALGAIQHMKRVGFWTKMYFHANRISSWTKPVKGSNGSSVGDGERFNQLPEEFIRIPEYMLKEQRDLCTFDELIGYVVNARAGIRDGKLTTPLSIAER